MKLIKRLLALLMMLFIVAAIAIAVLGYRNYAAVIKETSIEDKVSLIQSQNDYITIDHISENLINATIAIEDRRFYIHRGVDYISTIRAFIGNIFAKEIVSGGSTITQQLAKNMYLSYEPSYVRKVSEILIAYDLEKMYDKEKILELYLNIINYGDNHFGITQASYGYFGKSPEELTLFEASLLAGLPQSPSNYQLSDHYDAALIRQKQVLQAMVRDGYITELETEMIGE